MMDKGWFLILSLIYFLCLSRIFGRYTFGKVSLEGISLAFKIYLLSQLVILSFFPNEILHWTIISGKSRIISCFLAANATVSCSVACGFITPDIVLISICFELLRWFRRVLFFSQSTSWLHQSSSYSFKVIRKLIFSEIEGNFTAFACTSSHSIKCILWKKIVKFE